jgi:hypothetical protein
MLLDVPRAHKVPATGGIYSGCCTVAIQRSDSSGTRYSLSGILPAKQNLFGVDPRGLEPLASAMRGRHDTLLESSRACKTAANKAIFFMMLFPSFQEIYLGCCTVAAQYGAQDVSLGSTHKSDSYTLVTSCRANLWAERAIRFLLTESQVELDLRLPFREVD